jgi:excisionase family DNA binding protein
MTRQALIVMPPSRHTSEWLTAVEAAAYLKIEPRTLLKWAREGRVKGHVLSGTERITWRFRTEDLDATMSPPSVALTKRRIQ